MNSTFKICAFALCSILSGVVSAEGMACPAIEATVDPISGVERGTDPESGKEAQFDRDSLISNDLRIYSITLNRTLSSLVINFSVRERANVHLFVANSSGQTVVDFDGGAFPQGNANILVKVGELKGGDYTCRLIADDLVATEVVSIGK